MRTRSGRRSRSGVTDEVGRIKSGMETKETDMEVPVEDHEKVGGVMDGIEFGFTSDGADEVEQALRETQEVTAEVVEEKGRDLERVHEESDLYEKELTEGSEGTEADRVKVSDTKGGVKTESTQRGLERSLAVIQRELDFLKENVEASDEARRESKRNEDILQARVQKSQR